jgi:hypothetical protein
MFFLDNAVAIVVGMALLLFLSRPIGRIQFSLSTAFWCALIWHLFISMVGLVTGWLFAYQMAVGLLIELAIGWAFLAVLLKVAVRAKGGTLPGWRAAILSAIVIAGDFFIASRLTALLEHSQ